MKYRVILVDDEPAIAQGLGFLIQRFVPECEVIALAYDGQEGYEKIVELEPDIVITDIRMPEMDGIEMIQKLKDGGKEYYFIILSGYEEFEYARSAIQLGVEEYITKPVEEEELRTVLGKVCGKIEKECSRRMDHEKIQSAVKEYMMRDYLEGKLSRPELVRENMAEFGFPLSGSAYACAVLEVHSPEKGQAHGIAEQVKAFSQRYLEFCQKHITVENSETMVTVIMAVPENTETKKIRNRIGMVRLELAELSDDQVSAGISLLHYDGTEIRDAFTEAECALNYKLIKGLDCCISYEQIRDIETGTKMVSEEDLKKLEQGIDMMDEILCKETLDRIFRNISREKDISLEQLQMLSLNLLLTGIRKMPFMQFQLNEYLGKNIFSLESISKFKTIEQLKNWIFNVLKSMNELMLKDNLPEKRDVIEEAKEYIRKNFDQDISLNDISERFFINPSYFSQLFKKKTGKTYQNYLIEVRVARAKKLLDETDLKIYEICSLVGYSDANHFNRVFERVEGVKPSEYRRKQ